jgi:hypothetical protein
VKLSTKDKFFKFAIFVLLLLISFPVIFSSCFPRVETTKNFNSNSPTQIIGEESLTSPVNTFGISPKYNLDGETQKVGI